MRKQGTEQGFVLITALVLLSILTLLGITSQYKTVVEMKVSGLMAHGERAEAAASTGLTQLYWAWSADEANGGVAEFNSLIDYIGSGGTAPGVYQGAITPGSIEEAPTDAEIRANTNIKVFTITSGNVVNTYTWGQAGITDPQIAVWVTTFNQTTPPEYPYSTPVNLADGSSCSNNCRMVTYSLGKSGEARRLVRETHSVLDQRLTGVSAMTNAPAERDFAGICNAPATPSNGAGGNGVITASDTSVFHNALIEATQAPYALGSMPSGTALQSNTEIGLGGKNFRNGIDSTTGTNFEDIPYILYAGHGTTSAAKVGMASRVVDTVGTDLPANKLPKKLVFAPPTMDLTTERANFFTGGNTQLFSMDTYRWGAEQFTCQNPTLPDGQFGNGIYCSKGENLRQALVANGFPAFAPVTGRITIAQLEYNIANSIPMFGLVRVMFPAVPDGTISATCNNVATQLHVIESDGDSPNGAWDFNKFEAYGTYTGAMIDPATNGGQYEFSPSGTSGPDDDGQFGAKARWITYGMVLVDFFADYNIQGATPGNSVTLGNTTDTVFGSGGQGERLLLPLESPDVYLAVEHNFMVNPVMPRFISGVTTGTGAATGTFTPVNPYAFPTGASTTLPLGSSNNLSTASKVNMTTLGSANVVNLASPYDGYFPMAEGLLPPVARGTAGTMRLMSRDTGSSSVGTGDNPSALGLVNMAIAGFGVNTNITGTAAQMANIQTMLGWSWANHAAAGGVNAAEYDVLEYYYDLMLTTLDQSKAQSWPIDDFPTTQDFTDNFCMGIADCGTTDKTAMNNNMGDKIHLMFPTGYVHGWKVALAALDVTADEWNNLLTAGAGPGIGAAQGLYQQLVNDCSQFGLTNGAGCLMGQPYNFVADVGGGLATVQALEANSANYYYITKDAVTGYGLLDSDWKDVPSTMYSGGLLDMHAHSNITGIMYTPGPLEWEPGHSGYEVPGPDHMSYMNGALITGYGSYTNNKKGEDRFVMVFDMQSVDNINTNTAVIALRRYDWQLLQ